MEHTTEQRACLQYLRETERITAVLATASADGRPRASTVYYFVDDAFTFYFLTATNTVKYSHLQENHRVALAIGFGPPYTTVQVEGEAALLSKGSDEENQAIMQIKRRLQENDRTWPLFQLDEYAAEAIKVFRLTPSSVEIVNLESSNAMPVTTDAVVQVLSH